MSSVLARAVVVLEGDSKKLEAMMSESEKKMKDLGEGMKNMGEHLVTHVTLELVAMAAEAVHAFGEQEDALARTNALLRATGDSAGVTANHITELADSLQNTTTFSNDATQSAAAMLLTFTRVQNVAGKGNDVFDRTVKVGQDLAALMGGDLSGAMEVLGKAMEDPATGLMMLRRAGVVLSEAEKENIKNLYEHNRVLEAQKLILNAVEGRMSGLAKAMAKTPLGQFKQLWNQLTDAMKPFGGIIMQAITPVIHGIEALAGWLKNLSTEWQTVILIIAAVVASIGPLMVVIGTVMVAWATLSVVLGAAMAPILLIIAGIGLIVLAGYELVKHWTWVKLQVVEFWGFLEHIYYSSIDYVLGLVQKWLLSMSSAVSGLKRLPGVLGDLGTALAEPFDTALQAVTDLRDGALTLAEASEGKTRASVAKLTAELAKQAAQAKKTGKAVGEATPKAKPQPPVWAGPVTAALNDLQTALEQIDQKSALLGDAFDANAARASAYGSAIDTVSKSHVSLDQALDDTGRSLRTLGSEEQQQDIAAVMKGFSVALDDASKQSEVLGNSFDYTSARAGAFSAAVQALIGKHYDLDTVLNKDGLTLRKLIADMNAAKLDQIGKDLNDSLAAAAMQAKVLGANFDKTGAEISAYENALQSAIDAHLQLNEVVKGTGMTLEELIKHIQHLKEAQAIANQLRQTFTDLGDYLVDWAFGAKKSFGEFVRQALIDLTKLIVKMLILQSLKQMFDPAKGGVLGGIGKLLGFADGGFLQAGQVGMVGERGPELISGGRNGVSITPMPAMAAAGPAGSSVMMKVDVNVNAIDSKGVAAFFDSNEQVVAGAMMKAYSKSTMLQRRLQGR